MKELIKHTCGHDHTHDVYGKASDRANKVAWLETTVCPDCYRAQQEAKETAGKTGEWVEMPYSQFKNEYADCRKKDYNAKTKTIFVFVEKEEVATETPGSKPEEIKTEVIATLDKIVNGLTSNAAYDPSKHASIVDMWIFRKQKLIDCHDCDYIMDFFGDFALAKTEQETIQNLMSIYKIKPINGYDFK